MLWDNQVVDDSDGRLRDADRRVPEDSAAHCLGRGSHVISGRADEEEEEEEKSE